MKISREWRRRGLAKRLFAEAGFARKVTNEPNIAMDPRNFLALRVGARVPADGVRRFEATLFIPSIATREQHENGRQGGLA